MIKEEMRWSWTEVYFKALTKLNIHWDVFMFSVCRKHQDGIMMPSHNQPLLFDKVNWCCFPEGGVSSLLELGCQICFCPWSTYSSVWTLKCTKHFILKKKETKTKQFTKQLFPLRFQCKKCAFWKKKSLNEPSRKTSWTSSDVLRINMSQFSRIHSVCCQHNEMLLS